MLTYSKYFFSSLLPCLISIKDVDIRNVCTKIVCDRYAYIKDVLAFIGDIYIKDICDKSICIKNAYIKAFCINNTYISSPNIAKRLKIHLQLSQISEIKLFNIELKTRLGVN